MDLLFFGPIQFYSLCLTNEAALKMLYIAIIPFLEQMRYHTYLLYLGLVKFRRHFSRRPLDRYANLAYR